MNGKYTIQCVDHSSGVAHSWNLDISVDSKVNKKQKTNNNKQTKHKHTNMNIIIIINTQR